MEQPLATAIVDANLGQTYLELNRLDSAQKYLTLTTKFFFAQPIYTAQNSRPPSPAAHSILTELINLPLHVKRRYQMFT